MGRLYRSENRPVTFEQVEPGDVLISLDGHIEWLVDSKHEAVGKHKREIVTTVMRADAGSGLNGLVGLAHILYGENLIAHVRLKRKGGTS
jgi:hypothetical protein